MGPECHVPALVSPGEGFGPPDAPDATVLPPEAGIFEHRHLLCMRMRECAELAALSPQPSVLRHDEQPADQVESTGPRLMGTPILTALRCCDGWSVGAGGVTLVFARGAAVAACR